MAPGAWRKEPEIGKERRLSALCTLLLALSELLTSKLDAPCFSPCLLFRDLNGVAAFSIAAAPRAACAFGHLFNQDWILTLGTGACDRTFP
jgi:hypothetical protein